MLFINLPRRRVARPVRYVLGSPKSSNPRLKDGCLELDDQTLVDAYAAPLVKQLGELRIRIPMMAVSRLNCSSRPFALPWVFLSL